MPEPAEILFDMDGTLLDSSRAVVDAVASGLRRAYRRHGLTDRAPDFGLINACMGLPSREYFRRAYPPGSVPDDLREAFARSFGEFTEAEERAAIARGETRLYPGVETALDGLADRGHGLLLFSNAGRAYFRAVVAGHGLDRWFGDTKCLEEAIAEGLAADKAGMVAAMVDDPGNAVVVGDRVHDIEAGRSAGARTVGCLYGFGEPEEFRAADWIIDSPEKLLELPL